MKSLLGACALACSLGLAASAAAQPRPKTQQIDVVLTDFAFSPARLNLRQGQAYRLRFVNRGSGGHNFSAPGFFAAARIHPSDGSAIANGAVELGPSQSRIVSLVPAAGVYGVTCTHFLHAGFGMVGSITVN
ncbi:cupredoxin domain-containing protein [Microvirga arsenatis]|uniref:Copper-binding protein n=1 Tax=Microvirga arsenatis TaxID=2692265 RepID=A0ABW9Z1S7_9HYPH|nr:cupredoxin domain-containing protein [Microvirga arsenatis]NBJ12296.1 copper-binding protein [Microvirga arsenatis]NBJ26087.1 copper-binding protein [Microvirga arsenatis]